MSTSVLAYDIILKSSAKFSSTYWRLFPNWIFPELGNHLCVVILMQH